MTSGTVLVTGGAGYIGSHVCKALAEKGLLPITYDNLCSGNDSAVKWGPLEKGDIRDREKLGRVIRQYQPKAIMHFAALIQVGDSVRNPAEYYDNNIFGSFCLLEEARKHEIRHMVFSSTAAVYGIPKAERISENHHLNPINPYGCTKLAMEHLIKDYAGAYNLSYAILRYFNAAGADPGAETGTAYKTDTHIIPLLMRVASNLMPEIKIFGTDYNTPDGTAMRDYIHVSDLAEAHILALDYIRAESKSVTLNLGTNKGHTVRDIVNSARRITAHPIPVAESARRSGDPDILVADATKAQKILGWQPRLSDIETIIRTAWDWRQKQNGSFGAFAEAA